MNTLIAKNITHRGIHGETGHETYTPQRFSIDIKAKINVDRAVVTDQLSDTVDYHDFESIVQEVIGGESCTLIETLASRIAEKILRDKRICSVTVYLRKLDVLGGTEPAFVYHKDRVADQLGLIDIDGEQILNKLLEHGAVSVPILSESRRQELLTEAEQCSYVQRPEIASSGKVREQVFACDEVPSEGALQQFCEDFQTLLHLRFPKAEIPWWGTPFVFNALSLQKYVPGSIGITPHREGKSVINLFATVTLTGAGEIALCKNRAGENPYVLDTSPGNVVLVRAPGFFHSTQQPFHFLGEISEKRIAFCLRQRVAPYDASPGFSGDSKVEV